MHSLRGLPSCRARQPSNIPLVLTDSHHRPHSKKDRRAVPFSIYTRPTWTTRTLATPTVRQHRSSSSRLASTSASAPSSPSVTRVLSVDATSRSSPVPTLLVVQPPTPPRAEPATVQGPTPDGIPSSYEPAVRSHTSRGTPAQSALVRSRCSPCAPPPSQCRRPLSTRRKTPLPLRRLHSRNDNFLVKRCLAVRLRLHRAHSLCHSPTFTSTRTRSRGSSHFRDCPQRTFT